MIAKTHDAFAFASLVTVSAFYPMENMSLLTFIGSIIAADIGAAIPDMDGAGNRLWHMFPAGEKTGKFLRHIFYKHRTLSHSFVGMFLIFKGLEWMLPKLLNGGFVDPTIILWSVVIGIASHLLSDGLTEEGVPLLFPIPINFGIPPIKSWRIKTGHWFENVVVYPSVWIYVVWLIHNNRDIFVKLLKSVTS